MTRKQFLLMKLAEEASEISQIALKTSQFGLNEVYQVESNKERCHNELNDLLAIVEMLNEEFGFSFIPDNKQISEKKQKVNKYFNYSKSLGMVK